MGQAVEDPRIAQADRLFGPEPEQLPGFWYCNHHESQCDGSCGNKRWFRAWGRQVTR